MPGIDGWETIRRLRAAGHTMALAVVSANAFDKKLDNDVGLPSEDFLVKPVRLAELLDWLGRRLGLQWLHEQRPPAAPAPSAEQVQALPPEPLLIGLREAASLGHVRAVARGIDAIEAAHASYGAFGARMRLLRAGAPRCRSGSAIKARRRVDTRLLRIQAG